MISRIYSSTETIHPENDSAFPLLTLRGLSTDTKPTLDPSIPNGTAFLEIDTGDVYYFDGTEDAATPWVLPS